MLGRVSLLIFPFSLLTMGFVNLQKGTVGQQQKRVPVEKFYYPSRCKHLNTVVSIQFKPTVWGTFLLAFIC
jgi:hypothetical protein